MTNNFVFEPDLEAKKIFISREFNAPIEKVWKAWTEPALIEKWIAPKPWTAETKIMDFTVGGIWLYAMVGPEGQKHWTYIEFTAIEKDSLISSTNMFSDENGTTAPDGPKSYTETTFYAIDGNRTRVDAVKIFTEEATIKMFVQMGFKEGTSAGYNQLDELLAAE
jgi:uncharacterized protein YndB with AHSA1/START domain